MEVYYRSPRTGQLNVYNVPALLQNHFCDIHLQYDGHTNGWEMTAIRIVQSSDDRCVFRDKTIENCMIKAAEYLLPAVTIGE